MKTSLTTRCRCRITGAVKKSVFPNRPVFLVTRFLTSCDMPMSRWHDVAWIAQR